MKRLIKHYIGGINIMDIDKIQALCDKITKESQARLTAQNLGCESNLDNAVCHYKIGPKYTKIDDRTSGRYMIENATGEIYGIKAYGVINRGHFYGNLDTIDSYNWGYYKAVKIG